MNRSEARVIAYLWGTSAVPGASLNLRHVARSCGLSVRAVDRALRRLAKRTEATEERRRHGAAAWLSRVAGRDVRRSGAAR